MWRAIVCLVGLELGGGCQGYPFEPRLVAHQQTRHIVQQVSTRTPTDILFVVDNSGSMLSKRAELARNMGLFIDAMSAAPFDFHVGLVTTDVECNTPERDCDAHKTTSVSCCKTLGETAPLCRDQDLDGDGKVDATNCDGGRLRGPAGKPAFWTRPAAGEAAAWVRDFQQTIDALGCNGSGLEAGLEAARRAVSCSVFGYDPANLQTCPSAAVAQRNANFIRPEADLVLLFVTDEDDCSFADARAYLRPANPADPAEQAQHLCSPEECYAYYGAAADIDHDGIMDWADDDAPADGAKFRCVDPENPGADGSPRMVNPPMPTSTADFLAALIAAKGGHVRQVRAAGIVSGVSAPQAPLALHPLACTSSPLGPSASCVCWASNAVELGPTQNLYCALTASLGQMSTAAPPQQVANECTTRGVHPILPGCTSMPGGRYLRFLEALHTQRLAANLRSDTLAASICELDYSTTISNVVNHVILNPCFALGSVPARSTALTVLHNGEALTEVPQGSRTPGFSYLVGADEVCLEGGLHKRLGDRFDLFVNQAHSGDS